MNRSRVAIAAVLAAAVVLLVVLLAWPSDDDDGDAGPAGTVTSTTDEESTTSASTTSTPTTGGEPLPDEPPLSTTRASGSGCNPGGSELPDGWWYGSLESGVGDEVTFDLACYYVGAIAETEAAARGDEVNNDYYVVNESSQLRTVPVADGATASCVALGTGVTQVECDLSEVGGDVEWAVWLRVQGGVVDRVFEQYAP